MWKGFDNDVKRTTHMFEGIFIDSFDNDNLSDHPLNLASGVLTTSAIKGSLLKVSKCAKIRNRYNQVPHLTQDTNGKVTNSQ